jgi:polar amino acid transport system substrate-binding protein
MNKAHRLGAICALAVSLSCLHAGSLPAQSPTLGTVTVFTDGLAYPNGPISQGLTELSIALDKAGTTRLLPIMGLAGEANVRDLLHFRGADLAIFNHDVFASARVEKTYPEARNHLRYIATLRSQEAVLLAREGTGDIEQLKGKKVWVAGPESVAMLTARTVFRLLGVELNLLAAPEEISAAALENTDAVFFLSDDAKRIPQDLLNAAGFRPIPIPASPALASAYRPAQLPPGLVAGAGGEPIETIFVDTILASFNWTPAHGRYADVTRFIDGFFKALPDLRDNHPSSIWQATDPHMQVPGWQQHAYAAQAKKSVPPAAPPFPTRVATAPAPAPAAKPAAAPSGPSLRLSIAPHPPLTGQNLPGGGILTELTTAAVARMGWPGGGGVALQWEKDGKAQLASILSEHGTELGLPWEKPDCENTEALNAESAAFCDGALTSAPIFKVLIVLFTRVDNPIDLSAPDSLVERVLCVPDDRDLTQLDPRTRAWVRDGKLTLTRVPTLIDCLARVERREADAVLTNELEGKELISKLGLADVFAMSEMPVSVQDIHIVIGKHVANAEKLAAALDEGFNKLKSDGAYAQIVAKHLSLLNPAADRR